MHEKLHNYLVGYAETRLIASLHTLVHVETRLIASLHTLVILLLFSCNSYTLKDNFVIIDGKTQGTTYNVHYSEKNGISYETEIDSILQVIDNSLSTYNISSIISKFNASDTGCIIDEHILKVFLKSCEIHKHSNGAFDPTVMPLVHFWGFGNETINPVEHIDKSRIDSLLQLVGLEKIKLTEDAHGKYLLKNNPSIQLDFNAIAQGYTVDLIAEFLESRGVESFMVEIGGELRVNGKNQKGEFWQIGIDKPENKNQTDRPLQAIITLKNSSIATSGNYRKFYVKNGVKYSHTIDTKTGFPTEQKPTLLSVTVLTNNCMSADGYATAFMAMGLEKTKEFVHTNNFLQVFIVCEEDGMRKIFMTDKMKEILAF